MHSLFVVCIVLLRAYSALKRISWRSLNENRWTVCVIFFQIAGSGFAFNISGKDFVFAFAVRLGNIGYRNGGHGCK
ncbi:Uncharacterised protein [Neisseria gonorrhoeae]|uniref:Uncharacterized protein n=1 Tax=Neisseria gonorrhoeae TaxID=485 RepID=A0A378VW89_NEIGO|nr:Uncharacterised protein [Neisseria gonorrhoeae]